MALFVTKPAYYKAGIIFLFLSTAVFAVSFGAPYWIKYRKKTQSASYLTDYPLNPRAQFAGLWMWCSPDNCYSSKGHEVYRSPDFFANEAEWFNAVVVLESLCQGGLVISSGIAVIVNFCVARYRAVFHMLEILTVLSGTLGFSGAIFFAVELQRYSGDLDSFSFSVSYYLACIASLVVSFDGFLIMWGSFCSHREQARPPNGNRPSPVFSTDASASGRQVPTDVPVGIPAVGIVQPDANFSARSEAIPMVVVGYIPLSSLQNQNGGFSREHGDHSAQYEGGDSQMHAQGENSDLQEQNISTSTCDNNTSARQDDSYMSGRQDSISSSQADVCWPEPSASSSDRAIPSAPPLEWDD